MIMYLHRSLTETSHQLDFKQGDVLSSSADELKAPSLLKGSGAHHVLFFRAPKAHAEFSHS